ncbi:hypothetical protein TNCV_497191 [Trichonephila clavipes]|nr:hypothetical protein TNCV_497191 [Trichonephila clavipes]
MATGSYLTQNHSRSQNDEKCFDVVKAIAYTGVREVEGGIQSMLKKFSGSVFQSDEISDVFWRVGVYLVRDWLRRLSVGGANCIGEVSNFFLQVSTDL